MNLDDTPEQARLRARAWLEQHRDESPPQARGVHVADLAEEIIERAQALAA